ncbi:PKD domain-containing protein [Candidatus Harpocratesius sp.]
MIIGKLLTHKSKSIKIKAIVLCLLSFFSFSFIIALTFDNRINNSKKNNDRIETSNEKVLFLFPNSSGVHSPIQILNNSDWLNCDVVSGSGTSNDPFVISNITIDATGSTGILIQNSNVSAKIINCIIVNAYNGISLYNTSNCLIQYTIISNCSNSAIYMQNSLNCTIDNNTINNNEYTGIWANYCSDCIILGNNITDGNAYGIILSNSSDSVLEDNRILSNLEKGIWIQYSINCSISNNEVNNNSKVDLYLEKSINCAISNNIFINHSTSTDVISINSSINCTVNMNEISNTIGNGIFILSTNNSIFANNSIIHTSDGIYINNSNGCIFESNIILNNSNNGVKLNEGAINIVLLRNNISYNQKYAVKLAFESSFNLIKENYIIRNSIGSIFNIGINNTLENNYIVDALCANISFSPYSLITGYNILFYGNCYGGIPPYVYHWEFGDGYTSNDQNPLHSYADSGIYTVIFTIIDSEGFSCSNSISITIDSDLLPMASFSYSATTVAVGEIIHFADITSGGNPPYSYFWDFGDGTTSTEQNVNHSYSVSGEYSVFHLVYDYDGDSSNASTLITVIQNENNSEPYASIGASKTYAIPSEVIWFWSDFGGGDPPLTIHWDFGDGITSSEQNPKHSYSYSGIYTVQFTVTDNDGDSSINSILITIYENLQPIVEFDYSPSIVIVGTTVYFIDKTISGNPPLDYYWNFGDGSFSNEQNPSHIYMEAGTYSVFLLVEDSDGDSGSYSIEITVIDNPNSDDSDNSSKSNSLNNAFADFDWSNLSIPGFNLDVFVFSTIGAISVIFAALCNRNKKIYEEN